MSMTAQPPRAHESFTDTVRAEELPTRFSWHLRDTVAALAVPAIFATGWLSGILTQDVGARVVVDTAVRIVLFAVIVWANAPMLARHWDAFRRAAWRSIGLVVLGMIAIQVVVSVTGAVLRSFGAGPEAAGGAEAGTDGASLAFGVLLFASLAPMVTALIEDFAFRHTLMLKIPVWSRPALAVVLVAVNALVFGAIHINNFGGSWLLTLSYAGAGLLMNLIYLWTRNVWHVLLMHALNNFLLGGPVVLVLVALLEKAVV